MINQYKDDRLFFARVDLPAYPLKESVSFPVAAPFQSNVMFGDKNLISDEMAEILADLGIRLDYMILWTWNHFNPTRSAYQIHSDGHININPRALAVNWVLEGDSCVEWFSYHGAKPVFTTKNQRKDDKFTLTEWHYDSTPSPIARWVGKGPTVLNIKQPHSVVLNGQTTRRSITMRFAPNISMQEMIQRLGSRVLAINS